MISYPIPASFLWLGGSNASIVVVVFFPVQYFLLKDPLPFA